MHSPPLGCCRPRSIIQPPPALQCAAGTAAGLLQAALSGAPRVRELAAKALTNLSIPDAAKSY